MIKKVLSMFKNGDKRSERIIYEMFYETVYKISMYMMRDGELAQDVTQESFVKIYKNLHKLNDNEKIEAWVKTITRRTALDALRKQKKWNETPTEDVYLEKGDVEMVSEIETEYEEEQVKKIIISAIDELKPKYKEVMYLKFIEEMQDKEISEELDIKLGTVKSRIHRAKSEIKSKIEGGGCYEG